MLIMGYKSRALSLFLISAIVASVAERNPFLRIQGNEQKQDDDSDADESDELDENGTT